MWTQDTQSSNHEKFISRTWMPGSGALPSLMHRLDAQPSLSWTAWCSRSDPLLAQPARHRATSVLRKSSISSAAVRCAPQAASHAEFPATFYFGQRRFPPKVIAAGCQVSAQSCQHDTSQEQREAPAPAGRSGASRRLTDGGFPTHCRCHSVDRAGPLDDLPLGGARQVSVADRLANRAIAWRRTDLGRWTEARPTVAH